MSRRNLALFLATSLLLAGSALYVTSGFAEPPWAPFDNTRFAPIERIGPEVGLERLAIGLIAPVKGVTAPGLPNILFVVDQPGQIYAIDLTKPRPVDCSTSNAGCTKFHDVSTRLVTLGCVPAPTQTFGGSFDERGLLGLAFHPHFASNGLFYTYTSEPSGSGGPLTFPSTLAVPGSGDHQNVVAEWKASIPSTPSAGVIAASRRELIRVDWPQFNHDAGDLAFRASDGTLFISMGDGGGGDDHDGDAFIDCGSNPTTFSAQRGHGSGNGQKLSTPLGKILRIDVDSRNSANGQYGIPADNPFVGADNDPLADSLAFPKGSRPVVKEIFALGFRNPFRMSFDREDPGHFYVGNVGQNDIEEIELVRSGANHGWPIKEGMLFFNHNGVNPGFATPVNPHTAIGPQPLAPDLTDPVSQYDTHHEGHAVIAGFLYRGQDVPKLRGRFVFGDFTLIFRFPIGP